MRLVIEGGLSTGGGPTGIGHYTLRLYQAIRQWGSHFQTKVWIRNHPWISCVPTRAFRRCVYLGWLNSLAEMELFSGRVDIVHYTAYHSPLARWHRGARVFTVHDLTPWKTRDCLPPSLGPIPTAMIRTLLRCSDAIVTPTETVKRELVELFGVDPSRVFPCCWCTPLARGARKTQKGSFALGSHYFLFVGTLERRKNIRCLLLALARLRGGNRGKSIRLLLVGRPGFGFQEIAETVRAEGLGEAVSMLGYVHDNAMFDLYQGARALILPSLYEGFGIPLIEAMAVGTPVVASDIPVFREVSGRQALLYGSPDDVESLAQAMERVLDDNELRDSLAEGGMKRAQWFTRENVARDHIKAYRFALAHIGYGHRGTIGV